MSFSIINQKLVSSEGNIVILKQIHTGKNWHVFCFQSVKADPSHRSPAPATISKTKPWSIPESTSTRESEKPCFTASTESALPRLHQLFLSHHNPGQHPLEAPLSQTIQNQSPKQLPNKTCEILFNFLCQILSTVVQDTVSRSHRFGHK